MVSAKSSCHDITCESVPGSPPPFFFSSGRGESLGTRLGGRTWCELCASRHERQAKLLKMAKISANLLVRIHGSNQYFIA